MAEQWITVDRPGYFGRRRAERCGEYDTRYGSGNWRIVWEIGGAIWCLRDVLFLYEAAYLFFLRERPGILARLVVEARDIYDDSPTNVASGYDYTKQETWLTHLHDIAIRRCVRALGEIFQGPELIQIRDAKGTHPLSLTLSPGRVPFHKPQLIKRPELEGWWKPGTIESFYQSNKVLQVVSTVSCVTPPITATAP